MKMASTKALFKKNLSPSSHSPSPPAPLNRTSASSSVASCLYHDSDSSLEDPIHVDYIEPVGDEFIFVESDMNDANACNSIKIEKDRELKIIDETELTNNGSESQSSDLEDILYSFLMLVVEGRALLVSPPSSNKSSPGEHDSANASLIVKNTGSIASTVDLVETMPASGQRERTVGLSKVKSNSHFINKEGVHASYLGEKLLKSILRIGMYESTSSVGPSTTILSKSSSPSNSRRLLIKSEQYLNHLCNESEPAVSKKF
jgi:hypothetical protein